MLKDFGACDEVEKVAAEREILHILAGDPVSLPASRHVIKELREVKIPEPPAHISIERAPGRHFVCIAVTGKMEGLYHYTHGPVDLRGKAANTTAALRT
jgi:hypothetical protein